MPAPEALRRQYARIEPVLRELRLYVRSTLHPFCEPRGYTFFDRIKDLESLSEKLEGGRYSSWNDIDDLYAFTIVVPSPQHEEAVRSKLDQSFYRLKVRDRTAAMKAPDVFRFDGLRWYGRMRDDAASERQPGMGYVTFEAQVLTSFERAWAAVTHDLVYKADDVDWKRLRLAAQLKAAVEQIEMIIAAFEVTSSAVLESPWPETKIKQDIIATFSGLMNDGHLPETLRPSSWRRFADNVFSLVNSFEQRPKQRAKAIQSLLRLADTELRSSIPATVPFSGTLFQYVLSLAARPDTPGNLHDFTIVDSSELTTLYQLGEIRKKFRFPDVPGSDSDVTEEVGDSSAPEIPSQAAPPASTQEVGPGAMGCA
ncbi:hypothetical protein [Micromonospora sp. CPCC 205556]|uniref:hypothetical protein n=1 Tax=Micromonospora sp. CPCC 205556 TaxID=3122398 RepID=UPI002FEEC1AC